LLRCRDLDRRSSLRGPHHRPHPASALTRSRTQAPDLRSRPLQTDRLSLATVLSQHRPFASDTDCPLSCPWRTPDRQLWRGHASQVAASAMCR
jgi:hypothetical protein